MKTTKFLLLAATIVAALTYSNRSSADEPILSPRAAQLRNDFRSRPGVTEDQLYRGSDHLQRGWFAAPTMVASGGVVDVDYVHNTAVITLSPRALATFPHLAKVISVAPLK